MKVVVRSEAGHEEALLGMALSYYDGSIPVDEWWTHERLLKAMTRASILASRDGGHNKFLESIQVWLLITAPRYWWSQFDTYRPGVTKQSASTMHTLSKRRPTSEDFDESTPIGSIRAFQQAWDANRTDINTLKKSLPEGFLQVRTVCTNYKSLRHIYQQRKGHRLGAWAEFNAQLLSGLSYPEYIIGVSTR